MVRVKKSFTAEDMNGNEVFICKGDIIKDISDAGPYGHTIFGQGVQDGWNVSFRVSPTHNLWSEIVTYDAVKLLKALE